ncbi:P-loop containing nucleoside triphosphate hydrolase protein, partial [Haematococcus lacustris]
MSTAAVTRTRRPASGAQGSDNGSTTTATTRRGRSAALEVNLHSDPVLLERASRKRSKDATVLHSEDEGQQQKRSKKTASSRSQSCSDDDTAPYNSSPLPEPAAKQPAEVPTPVQPCRIMSYSSPFSTPAKAVAQADSPAQLHSPHAAGLEHVLEPEEEGGDANCIQLSAAAAVVDLSFNPSNRLHIALVKAALQGGSGAAEMAADAPADAAPAGRQQQFNQLHSLLSTAAEQGHGRSIYISGLPGTGKSHTVRAVLAALAAPPAAPAVRPPHPSRIPAASGPGPAAAPAAVFLSCFAIKDPKDIYSALLAAAQQQLGAPAASSAAAAAEGNSCPAAAAPAMDPEHAYSALLDLLHKAAAGKAGQAAGSRPSKKGSVAKAAGSRRMCVFVLDEVDRLLQGRNGVEELYKLFMLPHAAGLHCCVVALANSIDITERCLPALKCRGCSPDFLPFTAYSRTQVLAILQSQLATLPWPVAEPAALELVARKVAGSSGDLRKAFQACRFALQQLVDATAAAAPAGACSGPPAQPCTPPLKSAASAPTALAGPL